MPKTDCEYLHQRHGLCVVAGTFEYYTKDYFSSSSWRRNRPRLLNGAPNLTLEHSDRRAYIQSNSEGFVMISLKRKGQWCFLKKKKLTLVTMWPVVRLRSLASNDDWTRQLMTHTVMRWSCRRERKTLNCLMLSCDKAYCLFAVIHSCPVQLQ